MTVLAVAAAWGGPPADAHGPCPQCVQPAQVSPGDELEIRYLTYRAILNPTRQQLTMGPKPNCYGCRFGLWSSRAEGVEAVILGTWRPPRSRLLLQTPAVPSGRYLVALFDGSESGTHYTWDFVQIAAPSDASGSNVPLLIGAAAAAGFVLIGIAWGRRVARRR